MRIVGGKFKSRLIKQPKSEEVRPTKDMVREALFNVLGDRVIGATFLDLCCGSGAIGIEALSRGAKKVFFVDRDENAIDTVKLNLESLGLSSSLEVAVFQNDIFRFISNIKQYSILFDIVFLDPPYFGNISKKCLKKIFLANIISDSGVLVLEYDKKCPPDYSDDSWHIKNTKVYSGTALSFFEKEKGLENE